MNKLLSSLVALALCSSVALAKVPYPPLCVVTPCDILGGAVLCPDSPSPIQASVVTLSIYNQAGNPLMNEPVVVTFGSGPLCISPNMVFNATTNSRGMAVMTLRGGGCIQNTDGACVFRCNGVVIRNYANLKSPDWDGTAGDCGVNLPDFVRFASGTDLCFDFNNHGGVDLSDVVTFISGFKPAHHAP